MCFPASEKLVFAEASDRGTGRSRRSLNRQDKSISDEPLLQRVCGKAHTFSTALTALLENAFDTEIHKSHRA